VFDCNSERRNGDAASAATPGGIKTPGQLGESVATTASAQGGAYPREKNPTAR